jgi:hypothetical protein
MRTRLRICKAKIRYESQFDATLVASRHGYTVRPYRCDRCHAWHLTSRLKGKRMPRPVTDTV